MRDFSNAPVRILIHHGWESGKDRGSLNLKVFLAPLFQRGINLKNLNRPQIDRSANLQINKLELKKYGQLFSKGEAGRFNTA